MEYNLCTASCCSVLRSAAARGRILVSGNGVFGFDYDVANNRLIPNNKEVEVVHKIFQLYLEGNGLKKICNYLNSNNIPTKRGGKWNSEGVRTLLTNRKLIGESVRNRMCRSRITHRTQPVGDDNHGASPVECM